MDGMGWGCRKKHHSPSISTAFQPLHLATPTDQSDQKGSKSAIGNSQPAWCKESREMRSLKCIG